MVSKFLYFPLFLLILALMLPYSGHSQQQNIPLNRNFLLSLEKYLGHPDNTSHTAVKPYIESFVNYGFLEEMEDGIQKRKVYSSAIHRKIKYESFFQVDTGDFKLRIDPLFDFAIYSDRADVSTRADTTRFFTNTRGIRARGDITSKFSFESVFYENQSFFVSYMDEYVREWNVVPGQGRVKKFKQNGFDYAWATGYISYSPLNNINLQFGHGKHFIGEGYRSLLLSDNAFNYPYLKVNTTFNKDRFSYTNIFSSLQTLQRMQNQPNREDLFVRKNGTFHFFSWNITRRLQLGIFEGIIWKASENHYPQRVSPLFYNPVMLANTFLLLNDTNNNVFTGLNLKYKLLKKTTLYGQALSDGFKAGKLGWQAGVKSYDLFTIKNLHLQLEYNSVEPFTYSFHNPIQNFGHYNQPLAHPLGAGFKEAVVFIDYRYKDFFMGLKTNVAVIVKYDTTNITNTSNIFLPRGETIHHEPLNRNLIWQEVSIGYVINRKTNMQVSAGWAERISGDANGKHESRIFFFALRTNLFNRYYDF